MAGVYAPSLKFNANTWVSVKAADLTSYEDIQSTQGTIVYRAESLYLQTNSIDQINEPIDVQIYEYMDIHTVNDKCRGQWVM